VSPSSWAWFATLTAASVDSRFEAALAEVLRAEPQLIDLWALHSADQRSAPSAHVEGNETGWYDAGRQRVRVHPDEAAAVTDFIRRLAAWVVRGEAVD
jgi:hypothetical protein